VQGLQLLAGLKLVPGARFHTQTELARTKTEELEEAHGVTSAVLIRKRRPSAL
jgi:hypothetical protein